ncbi:hypothetical protein [Kutzneria chonburiensis]|uniref:HK97 gp10 family phage protein n=1 Tax=Kutzneria chonburiensis TaxID=1483604 RepID=A0ABV6N4C1_9PSEU|nr:hypothetical protein [Kutzneria chonburiensis]
MAFEFKPDSAGLREYLKTNPELRAVLERVARTGLAYARSIAPVGDPATDPDSGAYRDSLYAEIHVSPSRMSVRVGSTDYKRYWVENGAAHMPKLRVLGRTLDHMAKDI